MPSSSQLKTIGDHFGIVLMENTSALKIVSIGDIYLETNIDNKLVLRHAVFSRFSLISTCKLEDDDFKNYYNGGK